MIERYHISIFDIFAIASCNAVQRKGRLLLLSLLLLSTACCILTTFWFCCCTSAPVAASLSASMVVQFVLKAVRFQFAPGPFLPLFIAKFWSRYNTSIPTPNQSSSPLWIAASTPDTVPAIPCPLVKRLQPLHKSLCNVWSPPGQSWWSCGGSAFKISALA